jgi:hypothetical protein
MAMASPPSTAPPDAYCAVQPTALQDAIMGAVQATLPMPKAELE